MKILLNVNTICTGLSLILFVLPSTLASEGTDGILTELKSNNSSIVASGELIYKNQCAACHGAYLEGQPNWRKRDNEGFLPAPPHDQSGHTWHHSDDLLFEITKYGAAVVIGDEYYRTRMPAYKELLTDDEIIAVLSFIKNSWPEEQRTWQEEINDSQNEGFLPIDSKPSLRDKRRK